MKTHRKSFYVSYSAAILLASIAFVSCADKDNRAFREQYAMQDAAKNNAIAGTYRGSMLSVNGQNYQGELALTIQSDLRSINSQDGLGTELQAVINATVLLSGYSPYAKDFKNCTYAESTGAFSCADANNTVKIKGTIQKGTFSGTIEAEGAPEMGSQVNLALNGPAASVSSIQSKLAAAGPSNQLTRVYQGKVKFQTTNTEETMNLIVATPQATTDQAFNNLFQRLMTVNLTLIGEKGAIVTFQNAGLDQANGSVSGDSPAAVDGTKRHISCSRSADAKVMTCEYSADINGILFTNAVLTQVSQPGHVAGNPPSPR